MSHSKAPCCRHSEVPCVGSPVSQGKACPGALPALDKISSVCVSAVGLRKTYYPAWECWKVGCCCCIWSPLSITFSLHFHLGTPILNPKLLDGWSKQCEVQLPGVKCCVTLAKRRETKVWAELEASTMAGNWLGEIGPDAHSRKFMTRAVQKDEKFQGFPPACEVAFEVYKNFLPQVCAVT